MSDRFSLVKRSSTRHHTPSDAPEGPFQFSGRVALVLFSAIALFALTSCVSAPDRRVLFIGNSYTYYNDLPGQITAMAAELGLKPPVETAMITAGGATLEEHLENPETFPAIMEGEWGAVVIQGQSLEAIRHYDTFVAAAVRLSSAAASAGAQPYLSETWARAAGNRAYDEEWSGGSPERMQADLHAAYTTAAAASGATLIPVGTVWARFKLEHPEIPLFMPDGSHPTPQGSHLAATIVFTELFADRIDGLTYTPWGVTESEAKLIRAAASRSSE